MTSALGGSLIVPRKNAKTQNHIDLPDNNTCQADHRQINYENPQHKRNFWRVLSEVHLHVAVAILLLIVQEIRPIWIILCRLNNLDIHLVFAMLRVGGKFYDFPALGYTLLFRFFLDN